MKYLLLIYSNPTTWGHPIYARRPEFQQLPEREQQELTAQIEAMFEDIRASGELVGGAALADPEQTRTAQVRNGAPVITDGPFLEAKEQLAGYFVVDCDTPERAAEIAACFPDARFGGVEVRPIMDYAGQEM
jgi:hypothetical protein